MFLFSTYVIASEEQLEVVLAHPLFEESYTCSEHWAGQFKYLGDALGADCVVQELIETDGKLFSRSYINNGYKNEDWIGWHKNILSPCNCEVTKININPVTNIPGVMGKGSATSITLKREDGVYFTLAHLDEIIVKQGERVEAGQKLAKVGNNGYCRNPHVHIGSWKGKKANQIRFDQREVGKWFKKSK